MKYFNFPKEWINSRNIPKEALYKALDADEKLKKIFIENVDRIRLEYLITYKNSNIESYTLDDERYEEINFIKVDLREKGKENIILKLLHQLIPKGTVIILKYKDEILISLANKKITEKKIRIENTFNSLWLNSKEDYLKEFNYKNFNSTNLKLFYESIIEKVRVYNLSQNLNIDENIDSSNIDKLEALNKEIEELKALRKKEIQINIISELQIKIKNKIIEKNIILDNN